jgi:D-alanine-D-alanine ligase
MKMIIEELKSPVVVEEYIEGDEYEVSILGNAEDDVRVLPLSRSIFKEMPEGRWHIYTHGAKLDINATDRDGITIQQPAKNIPKKLETLITEISLDAYNILDCQDYATVEIRVDQFDNPYVLEVNANPMIDITDTLPEVAKLTQLSYGDFLEELIVLAVKRYAQQPTILNFQHK